MCCAFQLSANLTGAQIKCTGTHSFASGTLTKNWEWQNSVHLPLLCPAVSCFLLGCIWLCPLARFSVCLFSHFVQFVVTNVLFLVRLQFVLSSCVFHVHLHVCLCPLVSTCVHFSVCLLQADGEFLCSGFFDQCPWAFNPLLLRHFRHCREWYWTCTFHLSFHTT